MVLGQEVGRVREVLGQPGVTRAPAAVQHETYGLCASPQAPAGTHLPPHLLLKEKAVTPVYCLDLMWPGFVQQGILSQLPSHLSMCFVWVFFFFPFSLVFLRGKQTDVPWKAVLTLMHFQAWLFKAWALQGSARGTFTLIIIKQSLCL